MFREHPLLTMFGIIAIMAVLAMMRLYFEARSDKAKEVKAKAAAKKRRYEIQKEQKNLLRQIDKLGSEFRSLARISEHEDVTKHESYVKLGDAFGFTTGEHKYESENGWPDQAKWCIIGDYSHGTSIRMTSDGTQSSDVTIYTNSFVAYNHDFVDHSGKVGFSIIGHFAISLHPNSGSFDDIIQRIVANGQSALIASKKDYEKREETYESNKDMMEIGIYKGLYKDTRLVLDIAMYLFPGIAEKLVPGNDLYEQAKLMYERKSREVSLETSKRWHAQSVERRRALRRKRNSIRAK